QLVIVLVPSVSSAAAISLSTLFLAPTTSTAPASRAPPCTAKCSLILANNAFRTHPANLGVRSSPWPFGSTAYTPRSAMTVLPHSATVLVSPRQTHASVPTPRRRKPTPPSGSPSKWGSSPRRSPPCSVSYRTTSSMSAPIWRLRSRNHPNTLHCGSPTSTSNVSKDGATSTTNNYRNCSSSSSPAEDMVPRCYTTVAPSPGERNARAGH